VATPCAGCHKPPAGSYPPGPLRYHFDSLSCESCHRNPHEPGIAGADPLKCESCHTARSWKDLRAFDHDRTRFALLGAHRTLACTECHRPSVTAGFRAIAFHDTPAACIACHEDVHGGQFGPSGDAGCSQCHALVAWRPSIFNHEKQSHFSLKGAHEAVPCRDCHTQTEQLDGRTVVIYRKAPSVCSDCHSDKLVRELR
jgi:hypothetical protein